MTSRRDRRELFESGDAEDVIALLDSPDGLLQRHAIKSGNWMMKYEALHWLEHDHGNEALDALYRLLEAERSWRWRRRIKKVIRRK
jgi:hypothetical protein